MGLDLVALLFRQDLKLRNLATCLTVGGAASSPPSVLLRIVFRASVVFKRQ